MKTLSKNKIMIFVVYAIVNVLLSFSLLASNSFPIALIFLLFVSLVIGWIVYLFDLYNALKIEIYVMGVALAAALGYMLFSFFYYFLGLHPYIGIAVSVSFILASTVLSVKLKWQERLTETIYSLLGAATSEVSADLKTYRRYAMQEWFLSHPNFISNQTAPMFAVRVFFFVLISIISIYALLNGTALFISSDLAFDRIAYLFLMVYSIVYFIAGFRFSAKPAFIAWISILILYYLHQVVQDHTNVFVDFRLPIHAILLVIAIVVIVFVSQWAKNEVAYTNVQMFERGDQYYTVDLYLADFAPMHDLDTLLSFSIAEEIKTKSFVYLLKHLIKEANRTGSLFAGYITCPNQEIVTFYLYTPCGRREKLQGRIKERMDHLGYLSQDYTSVPDPQWSFYASTLHPDQKEFCSILSRNYMEDLFLQGVGFDKEYEIGFMIYFQNKNDFIAFEDRIRFFGFVLSYASFEETSDTPTGYPFGGEYKIKSFLTPRRIEYFNELLLAQTEQFENAKYIGEWKIHHPTT